MDCVIGDRESCYNASSDFAWLVGRLFDVLRSSQQL